MSIKIFLKKPAPIEALLFSLIGRKVPLGPGLLPGSFTVVASLKFIPSLGRRLSGTLERNRIYSNHGYTLDISESIWDVPGAGIVYLMLRDEKRIEWKESIEREEKWYALFQDFCNALDFIGGLFNLLDLLQSWNFFNFFLDI